MGEDGELDIIEELMQRMGINRPFYNDDLFYSAGTMLWYRPKAMQALFDLELRVEDFPEEPINVGGTIAHAIERVPALVCTEAGYHAAIFNEVEASMQNQAYTAQVGSAEPVGIKGALGAYIRKKLPKKVAKGICRLLRLP
jgi:lipopolysaccharide biosynthesis protein